MSTYVLIPGAGSDSWFWHRLDPELRSRGHAVVAPDLPYDEDSAGLLTYVDVVIDAIGDATDLVVVGHSFGAFVATLLCDRISVSQLVLLAGMVPQPGEPPGEWWTNTGWQKPADEVDPFLHDVPSAIATEIPRHSLDQSGTPFAEPWPLNAWPQVPTRFLLCRDDRFFPAEFMRRVVVDRLGLAPEEIEGGHLLPLTRPRELAELLTDSGP
jgi:pimeloyl-ACP methyl ester carboxylesterase